MKTSSVCTDSLAKKINGHNMNYSYSFLNYFNTFAASYKVYVSVSTMV